MNNTLNPKKLRYIREKEKKWTQGELAAATNGKISKSQISRWERGQVAGIRDNSKRVLCDALGVKWEELTRSVECKPKEDTAAPAELKVSVRPSTLTALELVRLIYRIPREDIVDLAPLLFLLTAQSSLHRRSEALDAAVSGVDEAIKDAIDSVPHLRHAFSWPDVTDIAEEEAAIEKRDVFFAYEDTDGQRHSPYVDYLSDLLDKLPEGLISEVPGKMIDRIWPGYIGAPYYRVSLDLLKKVLRKVLPNMDAKKDSLQLFESFVDLISEGKPDLRTLLEKHKRMSEDAFAEWIKPTVEKAKRISEGSMEELF